MSNNDTANSQEFITKEQILNLLAQEKEVYHLYLQLCTYYQMTPEQKVMDISTARMTMLRSLLFPKEVEFPLKTDGTPHLPSWISSPETKT